MNDKRFIFYADFLGTKERYSKPNLVVRGRELLEQALNRIFVPKLNDHDMYLYVHSDTVIVTCPYLSPLLDPISDLFNHFLDLQDANKNDKMNLWLRAAISYGKILLVDHLQNGDRIRTIPFLDTSLPTAYKLESIRKGSRVFIDPNIPDKFFSDFHQFILKWEQITGHGQHVPNVREFLWPAKIHCDGNRLAEMTLRLNDNWEKSLNKKSWKKKEYYESVIHLDEILKLFIRACSVFCSEDQKKKVLFSLLPKIKSHKRNIRYEWGIWFQALKGITENCEVGSTSIQEIKSAYKIVNNILISNKYHEHFLSELDFPDYASFKEKFYRIGLDRIT